MGAFDVCDGGPAQLRAAKLCLDELSKDARGELTFVDAEREECRRDDCVTLTTEHVLQLELTSHTCDSRLGARFDGRFTSRDLTTVFVSGSGRDDRAAGHTGDTGADRTGHHVSGGGGTAVRHHAAAGVLALLAVSKRSPERLS
jgi:hypothetical protein